MSKRPFGNVDVALTTEQWAAMQSKARPGPALPSKMTADEWNGVKAKGREVLTGMNKTEAAYAMALATRKLSGEVLWWSYEMVVLKLGFDTRYEPDFVVMMADGTLEFHEVKGFRFAKNMQKLRMAATMFPARFWLIEREGATWKQTIQGPKP